MKTDRRAFIGGVVAAAVLPRCDAGGRGEEVVGRRDDAEPTAVGAAKEFPILVLELCGKWPGEDGVREVTHLTSRRLVTVDLEDEEDWGDLNTFWDGADEAWGLGNDVDGYWKIERVFEIREPREELHEDKFPVAYEMSLCQLSDLMQSRIDTWCE